MRKYILYFLLSACLCWRAVAQPACEPTDFWCSILSKDDLSGVAGTTLTNIFIASNVGVGTNILFKGTAPITSTNTSGSAAPFLIVNGPLAARHLLWRANGVDKFLMEYFNGGLSFISEPGDVNLVSINSAGISMGATSFGLDTFGSASLDGITANAANIGEINAGTVLAPGGAIATFLVETELTLSYLTANRVVTTTTGGAITTIANGTANQVLGINSGATTQEYKTISGAGQNIITHAANSITVGSTVTNLAVLKTADQTLDSTTVNDDTHLQFALAAGEKAEFFLQAKFVAGSTAADGLKITMTNTATAATGQYGLWHHRISIAAGTIALNASQVTFGTTGTGSTIDADTFVEISGFIQQGTAPGTIKFQWAKNADAGNAHTCKSNSVVRVIKF